MAIIFSETQIEIINTNCWYSYVWPNGNKSEGEWEVDGGQGQGHANVVKRWQVRRGL